MNTTSGRAVVGNNIIVKEFTEWVNVKFPARSSEQRAGISITGRAVVQFMRGHTKKAAARRIAPYITGPEWSKVSAGHKPYPPYEETPKQRTELRVRYIINLFINN